MPFPMKIQPLDSQTYLESIRNDSSKAVLKSRLKRLFDRQFPNVLRTSTADKPSGGEPQHSKDAGAEFEPSSVCLAKMVQNFIEETNDKPSATKFGRNRCNCFNRNSNDSSDDEFDFSSDYGDSIPTADSFDMLKSLIPCASVLERNLLADTSKIVEKNKNCKRKDDLRKIVTDCLLVLGYDASICKSKWDKSPSYPAGEYEYIDVIDEGERLLIDLDFRSEFEIARSTSNYKSILQSLPSIFVGKSDRLQQIIPIVSEAAKQNLKKKGMHIPPWRKTEYMRAKWLSPHTRTTPPRNVTVSDTKTQALAEDVEIEKKTEINKDSEIPESECGELELIFGEKSPSPEVNRGVENPLCCPWPAKSPVEEKMPVTPSTWQLPAIKPRSFERRAKVVTGLASLLKDKA